MSTGTGMQPFHDLPLHAGYHSPVRMDLAISAAMATNAPWKSSDWHVRKKMCRSSSLSRPHMVSFGMLLSAG